MSWNWQQKDWAQFKYDAEPLAPLERRFFELVGETKGQAAHLDTQQITLDILCEEAIKSSKIEGVSLNRDSLRSSIKHQLGYNTVARKHPQKEAGIAKIMTETLTHYNEPLSHDALFHWHLYLTSYQWNLTDIGQYRTHEEVMQIVSGAIGHEKIHYVAPPSQQVQKEMQQFIQWYNTPSSSPLIHASIAHLYFLAIHPFEDGNGRLARALSIKSLSQSIERPLLISLSYIIERNKKAYYAALQATNRSNEISAWLLYFSTSIIQALEHTKALIAFVITKGRILREYKDQLNDRQIKIIKHLFDAGTEGFEGGLSAKNYMQITGASASSTTRDLSMLIEMNILLKTGKLKAARYYLNKAC